MTRRPAEVPEVPDEYVRRIAQIALALPGTHQEEAWRGVRWRVRQRTFGHVLVVADGRPAAYAAGLGRAEPTVVLVLRLTTDEHDALLASGPRYFAARPGGEMAGVVIDADVDWSEVAELLAESHRLLAPPSLRAILPP